MTTPFHERDDEFVGKEELLQQHQQQLQSFERWARDGDWRHFHHSHYDWWAFPIAQPSRSYGRDFAVPWEVVLELRDEQPFLDSLHRSIELLCEAWGWDLGRAEPISGPAPDQAWAHWPIRLKKATVSARLFGLEDDVASLVGYAEWLDERGMLRRYRRFFKKMRGTCGGRVGPSC